jgi:hypothetical protein
MAQWVKIKKKLDKLITFFLMHFFSNMYFFEVFVEYFSNMCLGG